MVPRSVPDGSHHDRPRAVDRADDEVGARARVGEEHLGELRAVGEVADGADVDARLVGRHEDQRQPAVLRRVGIRPAQHVQPVGARPEGHPDLLAVQHPLVAVAHGAGAHATEIGSGLGLAEALAPHVLAAHDARQEASLLLGRCRRAATWGRRGRARARRPSTARGRGSAPRGTRAPPPSVPPRPPYSTGHVMPSQPPSASSRSHARRSSHHESSVGPPTPGWRANSPVRCSANQSRISSRRAAWVGVSARFTR